jgi:hypothetical protein
VNFVARLLSTRTIRIDGGVARTTKGKCTRKTLHEIERVFRDIHLSQGEIWVAGDGHASFSSEIPEKYHQRFRNIIVEG